MRSTHSTMIAAALLASVAGLAEAAQAMPPPRKGGNRDYKPADPRVDSDLAREIAEHNRAVEYRKAEKKAAKRARRLGVA